MKTKTCFYFFIFYFFLTTSCNYYENEKYLNSDTLYVFHAGSLSQPFHILKDSFLQCNPNVKIFSQACGSKQCVRNIIDLQKKWDIFFSADIALIDSFLIPKYSNNSFSLVTNEMVVAYTKNSRYSKEINANNWLNILQRPDVKLAFSDPASDPCGVRAIGVLKLSESYYNNQFLLKNIRYKNKNIIIRPKEVDIISLLELGEVDYTIIYKSVAKQYNLQYLTLPDSINLSNIKLQNWYKLHSISYNLHNNKIYSEPASFIRYGYSINKNSEQKLAVKKFLEFLNTSTAKKIFENCGHKLIYE